MRLSAEQKTELQALEGKVRRGQRAFLAMCEALSEIEAQELYAAEHDSMTRYCSERWDLSPSMTSRYLAAGQVLRHLRGFDRLPVNESQARELARVNDPEQQCAIWQSVLASEAPMTAGLIREVIAEQDGAETEPATLGATENDDSFEPSEVCEPVDMCAGDEVPVDFPSYPAEPTAGETTGNSETANTCDAESVRSGYGVAVDKACCAHSLLIEALNEVRQHDSTDEEINRLQYEVGEVARLAEQIEEHLVDHACCKETGKDLAFVR